MWCARFLQELFGRNNNNVCIGKQRNGVQGQTVRIGFGSDSHIHWFPLHSFRIKPPTIARSILTLSSTQPANKNRWYKTALLDKLLLWATSRVRKRARRTSLARPQTSPAIILPPAPPDKELIVPLPCQPASPFSSCNTHIVGITCAARFHGRSRPRECLQSPCPLEYPTLFQWHQPP
jgi:hypothetical protein